MGLRTAALAKSPLPSFASSIAVVLAALYLSCVWLDAVGSSAVDPLPRPARFFVQVAKLFPSAARQIIEWHAKGYRCAGGRFEELDVRPYFPIHADDKENGFDRAMFFYFQNRTVQKALDDYFSQGEARRGSEYRLGGVMLMSVRLPIAEPGQAVERYRRRPLEELPREAERKYWYVTDPTERERRCAEPH
jgi:hypothetical protein